MTETTLAHFSDPHLGYEPRLRGREHFSKRQLSAWSWRRARRGLQQDGILEALVADVKARVPDHIVITGDLTNFSLAGEFAAAADWLETLGAAQNISVVPGNHDALVKLDPQLGLDRWRRWMCGDDGAALAEESLQWPFVRVRGHLALIGVNSALPTLPLLAGGRIGNPQLEQLEVQLTALGARGLFRIVLLHHPVADGAVSARKALSDRRGLQAVLQRAGAELVLHGHARDARFDSVPGPHAPVLCLGLPSSSAVPSSKDQGARWHQLKLRSAAEVWSLQIGTRVWDIDQRAFVSAGTYNVDIPRSGSTQ